MPGGVTAVVQGEAGRVEHFGEDPLDATELTAVPDDARLVMVLDDTVAERRPVVGMYGALGIGQPADAAAAAKAESGRASRPGDDCSQGDREGAAAPLSNGRQVG